MGRSDNKHDRGSSRHRRDRSIDRHRSTHRSRSPDDRYSRHRDSRSRSRSPSRRREKRRRSPSVSSSDSYSSESEDERRRKNKHKKRKKEKKHKSKKSKKKKKSKELKVGDEWGKYGIINESDIFTKEPEFHAWLLEVKNINPTLVNKMRSRELFIDFMDDYNTATMPHEKYYNMAKWEARQHAIRMGGAPPSDYGSFNFAQDEEKLRMQHRQAARAAASAKQTPVSLSKEQLEELTKVNRERVQADRMRRMGLTPKEGMGVRYEYDAD